jgi:DNA polymerase II small subunit/DNA polymerase delta subunit B
MIQGEVNQLKVRAYKMEKRMHELEKRMHELEKRVKELEKKTASDLSQEVVEEIEASEEIGTLEYRLRKGFEALNLKKENSEKPNNQTFDRERALELLQDIESCSTKNSNASTKAILLSCEELRQLLGNE